MKNYKKPCFIDTMNIKMETITANSGDREEVVALPDVCPVRGYQHPTLVWCVGCKNYYTEGSLFNLKARCSIRNTFN
ncbi:MAG: hypothetical protein PUC65_16225 [Clostridiales bacterium]|nr:hypothetical protein [Clostridiales bacterium]